MKREERGQESSCSLVRLSIAAVIGAIAAAIIGFGASIWVYASGLGIFAPAEGINASTLQTLTRSGLNFLASHHIRIVGDSVPGGDPTIHTIIIWPITLWALIPAISLIIGGYFSRRILGKGGWVSGAFVAVPYTILLAVGSGWFTASTANVVLPAVKGLEIGGSGVSAVPLRAVPASLIVSGLTLGVVFGGLGADVTGAIKLRWPVWLRGAFISLLASYAVFLIIIALASGFWSGKISESIDGTNSRSSRIVLSSLPAAAGLGDYLAHGATVSSVFSSPFEDEDTILRVGLLRGVPTDEGQKKAPVAAYLLMILPAAILFSTGRWMSKQVLEPVSKLSFVISFAGSYALILTACTSLFSLVQSTTVRTSDISNTLAVRLSVAPAEVFLTGLVMALVFGYLGLCRRK